MDKDFLKYLHNYAVWTAARAAQRGFTTTKNISAAISETKLCKIENEPINKEKDFDDFHKKSCNEIIAYLSGIRNKKGDFLEVSYGRAAKIINVYLKTAVVIKREGKSKLAKLIHPPIDSILLKILNEKYGNDFNFSGIKWTKLTEKKYFEIIDQIRKVEPDSLWKIEIDWSPENLK